MTKRAIMQTCKFFLHLLKQINIDDKIKLYNLFRKFRVFQALDIFLIFDIEVVTNNRNILIDKIDFRKMLIFL